MSAEWIDLRDLNEVAIAQKSKWEIEEDFGAGWRAWDSKSWYVTSKYRGRPRQPKKVTVTSECWRDSVIGSLIWLAPGAAKPHNTWKRFPAGDRVGEIEA